MEGDPPPHGPGSTRRAAGTWQPFPAAGRLASGPFCPSAPCAENRRPPLVFSHFPRRPHLLPGGNWARGKTAEQSSCCHGPDPAPGARSRGTLDCPSPPAPGARPQQTPSPRCPLLEASAEGPGPLCSEARGRAAPGPEAQPARTSGRLSSPGEAEPAAPPLETPAQCPHRRCWGQPLRSGVRRGVQGLPRSRSRLQPQLPANTSGIWSFKSSNFSPLCLAQVHLPQEATCRARAPVTSERSQCKACRPRASGLERLGRGHSR